MDPKTLLEALLAATTTNEVSEALEAFETAHGDRACWTPVGGKQSNRGPIEVSADPGRSLVERVTNAIDAVLEEEHERHGGVPECRSTREAAVAWLGVPDRGLSEMTPAQRRAIANRVVVTLSPGEGGNARLAEVRDHGIGIRTEEMSDTILSLNENNKIQKHYLAGTYGQGGSSTFASSTYTLIASRWAGVARLGFTVVKFLDLPPEEYKTGYYAYLTLDGSVLSAQVSEDEFSGGTLVKQFGYDLSNYTSPLGPTSIYGLLNQVLFDPVLPIWLDSRVHGYRRVIKGSRNALNGAVDEGDESRAGPTLDHNVPMFYVSLGDFGNLGFEYWVLERPTQSNKRPSAAFVNPSRPIVLTLNGQNQAELPQSIVRKEAELPYLSQRLIVHVSCDALTPTAKRLLFASSREDARRGVALQSIHDELVRILRSDDELTRLNHEAREQGMQERDESAIREMRQEVARLLRLHGLDVGQVTGARSDGRPEAERRPRRTGRARTQPKPIEVHEPPTYVRIVWNDNDPITVYAEERRYIRIETDANSNYHNPNDPRASRINIICEGPITLKGSTPLRGGRMRAILDAPPSARVGEGGLLLVELTRPGLSILSDKRDVVVQERPRARPGRQRLTLPPFEMSRVDYGSEMWVTLGWPDDVSIVASSAQMEGGTLTIYYSTAYPKYTSQVTRYEQRDPTLARSFISRYEIWLATHSLLYYRDEEQGEASGRSAAGDAQAEVAEESERQERCRMATVAALFAAREIERSGLAEGQGEDA